MQLEQTLIDRTQIGYPKRECVGSHPRPSGDIEILQSVGDASTEKGRVIDAGGVIYKPVRVVGQGGMAVVWEAEAVSAISGEKVRTAAVKQALDIDPRLDGLLRREAELNLKISGKSGVIQTLHIGRPDEPGAIIMPFYNTNLEDVLTMHHLLPGRNTPREFSETTRYLLRYGDPGYAAPDRIRRIPDKFVAYFMYMIARTLQLIHEQEGIIHRDLSPGNVLVDDTGYLFLADFGVAIGQVDCNTIFAGKLGFTSQEGLFAPAKIDQRSDLYSLGVMGYQMLTGMGPNDIFRVPKKFSTVHNPMTAHCMALFEMFERKPVPPHEIVRGINEDFSRTVQKLVATNPDDRYQSAADLVEKLTRFIHRGPGPTPAALETYLKIQKAGTTRVYEEQRELQRALGMLDFLPRDNRAPLKDRLLELAIDGRIKPHIFQQFVLTDYAMKKLDDYENPTRR